MNTSFAGQNKWQIICTVNNKSSCLTVHIIYCYLPRKICVQHKIVREYYLNETYSKIIYKIYYKIIIIQANQNKT